MEFFSQLLFPLSCLICCKIKRTGGSTKGHLEECGQSFPSGIPISSPALQFWSLVLRTCNAQHSRPYKMQEARTVAVPGTRAIWTNTYSITKPSSSARPPRPQSSTMSNCRLIRGTVLRSGAASAPTQTLRKQGEELRDPSSFKMQGSYRLCPPPAIDGRLAKCAARSGPSNTGLGSRLTPFFLGPMGHFRRRGAGPSQTRDWTEC